MPKGIGNWKRGRRGFKSGDSGMVPFTTIAARMGISERNAYTIYSRAIKKLRDTPNAFETLLLAIRTSQRTTILRAGSAECLSEFRAMAKD